MHRIDLTLTPLDMVLVVIAAIGLPAWSVIAGRWYARHGRAERRRSQRYWIVIVRGAILSGLVLLTWARAGRSFALLGFDSPVGTAGRVGLLIDVLIIGYYFGAVQLRKRSREHLDATRTRLRRLRTYDMLPQTAVDFATYPIAATVGSVFEELLYRGYLIAVLAPPLGVSIAVLSSAVLFGFGHLYQGTIGVVRTVFIGLALGVGLALTHSLWWLMIAHASANLSGIMLARRLRPASIDAVTG
jgi:membrane protease YdiL (CAAX protease family)